MFTTSETRAVQQLSTENGALAVLAADQRVSLRAMFERRGGAGPAELGEFKRALVQALAPAASAVLLDPEIALPDVVDRGLVPRQTGILVSVEVSGDEPDGDLHPARLLPDFGAAGVRRVGGTAAKLLVRLRADREDGDGRNARDRPRAGRRLRGARPAGGRRGAGVPAGGRAGGAVPAAPSGADPGVRRPARGVRRPLPEARVSGQRGGLPAVTDAVGVPWALLSAGVDHETFTGQLRAARAGGASGFIAGRSIWKDAVGLPAAERDAFLRGEARRRLEELFNLL